MAQADDEASPQAQTLWWATVARYANELKTACGWDAADDGDHEALDSAYDAALALARDIVSFLEDTRA